MNPKWNIALSALFLVLTLISCRVVPGSDPIPVEITQPSEEISPSAAITETLPATVTDTPSPTTTATGSRINELPVFNTPVIFNFSMFTPDRGWAITRDRNHLLNTDDGGQTWRDTTPPELNILSEGSIIFGMRPFFLDENTAWFMSSIEEVAMLYHTRDGGHTWVISSLPFEHAHFEFLDLNAGYALVDLGAGAGSHYVAIYQTLDSGVTWRMVFTHEPGETKSLPNSGSKNGITFRGVDHGWIGGAIPMEEYFYLYSTDDAGATWLQETDIALPEDYTGSMLDVWQPVFVEATSAFLPVRAYPPGGGIDILIYGSDDYGETWSFRGGVESGDAVDFLDVNQGWIAAGEVLFQTQDGSITWSESSTAGIATGEVFLKVDFVDSLNGWVLTTPDSSTWETLKFYRTVDGGTSWILLLP